MNSPLRLEYVEPESLAENPSNWRRHPAGQLGAIGAAILECGWVKPLIFNEATGRLIDGHARRSMFVGRGPVPVVIGSWDEATERKILATLDTVGLLAETDASAWAALLSGDGAHEALATASGDLADLLTAVSESAGLLDGAESDPGGAVDEPPADVPPSSGVPDALWPTDNDWGVPALDPAAQADALDMPLAIWGSIGQGKKVRGTYCFYTADDRFEPLWLDPSRLLKSGCPTAIEPNFTTHEQTPPAVALWGVYRKRWMARYWQSRGVRIFVDLNVHERFRAVNLIGVPRTWRAFATRSHGRGDTSSIEAEFAGAAEHVGTDRLLFAVYGGGQAVQQLCGGRGWVWVPEHSDSVRGKAKVSVGQE